MLILYFIYFAAEVYSSLVVLLVLESVSAFTDMTRDFFKHSCLTDHFVLVLS